MLDDHNVRIMGKVTILRYKRLGGTHTVLIDTEDLPKLTRLEKPYISCNNNVAPYYLYAKDQSRTTISIARLLSDCPSHLRVSYINDNSLDLRKSNLKLVTPLELSLAANYKRHHGKEVQNA